MSRMTAALLVAISPHAADAQAETQSTAEQALARYRETFKPLQELDCPREAGEIVVCAPRKDAPQPYRLPLGSPREPGARVRGEASGDGGGCISRCHQPVGVNILAIPGFVGKVIERLKDD